MAWLANGLPFDFAPEIDFARGRRANGSSQVSEGDCVIVVFGAVVVVVVLEL